MVEISFITSLQCAGYSLLREITKIQRNLFEKASLLSFLNLSLLPFLFIVFIIFFPRRKPLRKKRSFPLSIYSVNVVKSRVSWELVIFTQEILNGKRHFLCSKNSLLTVEFVDLNKVVDIHYCSCR